MWFAAGLGGCFIALCSAGLADRGPADSAAYFERLAHKLHRLQQIPEATTQVMGTILQEHHYARKSPFANASLEARQLAAIAAIETLLVEKSSFAGAQSSAHPWSERGAVRDR
jgi:plasmid stabilization system protein ParE